MIEAYKGLWSNAFDFSGRSRRRDYWLATLFNIILIMCFDILSLCISEVFYIIYILYTLLLIVPSLSLTVRRLHDTGKNGFNIFWSWVPLIGGIIVLVLLCIEGDSGPNKYGADPKRAEFNPDINSL